MILAQTAKELEAWFIDAAAGRLPWPNPGHTPWDEFYGEYRSASPATKARADAAVTALANSADAAVRFAVATHWLAADRQVALPALLELISRYPDLYADQRTQHSSDTLRGIVLCGLAEKARGPEAAEVILRGLGGVDPVPSPVGTYFGSQGVDAVAKLVACRADPAMYAAFCDAGYELHRDAATWQAARLQMAQWPVAVQQALVQGANNHAARFGGEPCEVQPSRESAVEAPSAELAKDRAQQLDLRPQWLPTQAGPAAVAAAAGPGNGTHDQDAQDLWVAGLALAQGGASAVAVLSDSSCWLWLPDGTHRQLEIRADSLYDAGSELFFVQPDALTQWDTATLVPTARQALPFAPSRTVRSRQFAVVETTEAELFRIHLQTGEIQPLPWRFAPSSDQPLLSFCCDEEGQWLAAVHPNHLRVWDLANPLPATEPLCSFAIDQAYQASAAWYGERLLIYGAGAGRTLVDPNAAAAVGKWPKRLEPLLDLGPAAVGGAALVLAVAEGQRLVAVERDSARERYAFDQAPFERLELSSDQRHVVGWQEGELSVWHSASGALVGRWSQGQRIRNARMVGTTVAFGAPGGEVIFLLAGHH
jgi:hypothetical protein